MLVWVLYRQRDKQGDEGRKQQIQFISETPEAASGQPAPLCSLQRAAGGDRNSKGPGQAAALLSTVLIVPLMTFTIWLLGNYAAF